MAWELNGNAGTNPAITFLGTTDGKPLVIQRADGNVGIGTTKPDTRLNVNSNAASAQAVLVVSNLSADTRVGLWSGFGSGGNPPAVIYTHDLRFGQGKDFSSGTGFKEAMRITADGKIGIGLEHPSSKVEIAEANALSVSGSRPFITLRDTKDGRNAPCLIQGVDGGLSVIPESFEGGAAPLVVLNGTGNVGIGTVRPGERLHVVGPARIENNAGIGLVVSAITDPSSTAFFAIQNGNGNIMVGRNANFEVFRVTNNGDVQVRGVSLTCDIDAKDNFSCVNTRDILERLAGMPIREWNYRTDPISVRHIGPTSQDFQAAFELNGDNETDISSVDAQGVALAAIQGLNAKLNAENAELRTTLAKLERRLATLKSNSG